MSIVWQDPTTWSCESSDGKYYIEERYGRWHTFINGKEVAVFATKQDSQQFCQHREDHTS